MTTANMNTLLEQLVSAAEADGWQVYAIGSNLWYKFPETPRPEERPDAIEHLNIAREDPEVRAALVPFLIATGRTIPCNAAA